jgi:hypothetical protein
MDDSTCVSDWFEAFKLLAALKSGDSIDYIAIAPDFLSFI